MQFTFFSQAGAPLFVRDDALSAVWTHEEFLLDAEFPYSANAPIRRGQRIAFVSVTDGALQAFEIRHVETLEPDHTQRIIAEHIALAELSDEHIPPQEITEKTVAQVLTTVLTGTLWSVGNVTVTGTSSCNLQIGSVWEALGTIRENWNCYIVPRVVWGAQGITGRYIDAIPAGGTWRGVRLSVDSNADEVGVTYDDTETLTALYGYGLITDGQPLNFSGVTWTTTGGDPANKPAGQTYVEDAAATAAYGRNGRPRFGYYQNNDISSASVLLQKTWEALQATNAPRVTISCRVIDLYRLGYAAQPIRLHDTALIEISPTGTVLTEEIIQLQEDLLDPASTALTIGRYIPNIIYIQRQTARRASGGRGGGGGRGQTIQEAENSYFYTLIDANSTDIALAAVELGVARDILRQAGLSLNAQGVLVYADDNVNMWQSRLNVQADRIGLVVQGEGANASIKAASITAAIDAGDSSVHISANKILLDGQTSVRALLTGNAQIALLDVNDIYAVDAYAEYLHADYAVYVDGQAAMWQDEEVVTGVTVSTDADPVIGMVVTGVTPVKKTIYYLGKVVSSS